MAPRLVSRIPGWRGRAATRLRAAGLKCVVSVLVISTGGTALPVAEAAEKPSGKRTFGANKVICRSGSDTLISVPFHRRPAFQGRLKKRPQGVTLNVEGSPNWKSDEFAQTHFVHFRSGALNGGIHAIAGNAKQSLNLELNGNSLAGAAAGDRIAVVPYWTLRTLLPPGNATVHVSPGTSSFERRTTVLLHDSIGEGVNLSAAHVYFQTDAGWFEATNGNSPADDAVVYPDGCFRIRHTSFDPDSVFVTRGYVETGTIRIQLDTLADGQQDNCIGLLRPVPALVRDLGLLHGKAFEGSEGTSSFVRRDTILVFDNDRPGYNKSAEHVYFFDLRDGQWKDAVNGHAIADEDTIQAGSGVIIRKAASDGFTRFWINQPAYEAEPESQP